MICSLFFFYFLITIKKCSSIAIFVLMFTIKCTIVNKIRSFVHIFIWRHKSTGHGRLRLLIETIRELCLLPFPRHPFTARQRSHFREGRAERYTARVLYFVVLPSSFGAAFIV